MDNKQAIKNIKEHCYFANLLPQAKEALDMAVQALEQEPCMDAVSRKDIYFKLTNGAYPNETIEQFIDRLVKELEDSPSVTLTQENKEKLITEWLINNVFRNDDYYTLHDEETLHDLIWNLMEIIASLHNEYYKAIHGQYYDYMFHWVNKMNAGSIIDDIFKEFK